MEKATTIFLSDVVASGREESLKQLAPGFGEEALPLCGAGR